MMMASACAARSLHTAAISAAVTTSVRATPGRSMRRETGPVTSSTRAPRAAASSASAKPILPLLRLPMYRTGSMASCVPPAVTSRRLPLSLLRPTNSAYKASTMASGSLILPSPTKPLASSPLSGPMKRTFLPRSASMFFCVPGSRHISKSMAGAAKTGQAALRKQACRRLSQSPWVILPRVLAVAGAIRRTSAQRARWTWSFQAPLPSRTKRSVSTGRLLSVASVSGVMKSCAAGVITTCTSQPAFTRSLVRLAAL